MSKPRTPNFNTKPWVITGEIGKFPYTQYVDWIRADMTPYNPYLNLGWVSEIKIVPFDGGFTLYSDRKMDGGRTSMCLQFLEDGEEPEVMMKA